jgi:hypothetical protein
MVKVREVVLNIGIDEDWTTDDFATLFQLLSTLYNFLAPSGEPVLASSTSGVIIRFSSLKVLSIKYGSPGKISLLGVGEAMKQIKEFLMYLMDRDLHREERSLKNRVLEARARREELFNTLSHSLARWNDMEAALGLGLRQAKSEQERLAIGQQALEKFFEDHKDQIIRMKIICSEGKVKTVTLDEEGGGSELEGV